jgi:hypothetical protein
MFSTRVEEEFFGALANVQEALEHPNDKSLDISTRVLLWKVLLSSNDNIAWKEVKWHEVELVSLMQEAAQRAVEAAMKKVILERAGYLTEVLDTRSITLSPSAKKCLTEQYGDKGLDIKKILDFLKKNDEEDF